MTRGVSSMARHFRSTSGLGVEPIRHDAMIRRYAELYFLPICLLVILITSTYKLFALLNSVSRCTPSRFIWYLATIWQEARVVCVLSYKCGSKRRCILWSLDNGTPLTLQTKTRLWSKISRALTNKGLVYFSQISTSQHFCFHSAEVGGGWWAVGSGSLSDIILSLYIWRDTNRLNLNWRDPKTSFQYYYSL